jgi:hypothetical protein
MNVPRVASHALFGWVIDFATTGEKWSTSWDFATAADRPSTTPETEKPSAQNVENESAEQMIQPKKFAITPHPRAHPHD